MTITDPSISVTQDVDAGVVNNFDGSYGCVFNSNWYVSRSINLYFKSGSTWASTGLTLSTGNPHMLENFESRQTLAVADGNLVRQVTTGHAFDTQLTLPVGTNTKILAYSGGRLGIVCTASVTDPTIMLEALFYVWDGSTTGANSSYTIGASAVTALVPYKNSWVILTQNGQLLYFNGGGFDEIARMPYTDKNVVNVQSIYAASNAIVEKDKIYFNIGCRINGSHSYGNKLENNLVDSPAGVWCFDPAVGMYHMYSPSGSSITSALVSSIDTSANTFTIGADISTGEEVLVSSASALPNEISVGEVYYAINVSATVIKLATTYANALAGTAIDISGSATNLYFIISTWSDFGATVSPSESLGALYLTGGVSQYMNTHLFFGAPIVISTSDAGTRKEHLCSVTKGFKNTGEFEVTRAMSQSVTDSFSKIYLKYRPLKINDTITVKYRSLDTTKLPMTIPVGTGGAQTAVLWASTTQFTYGTIGGAGVLDGVKEMFDAGYSIDVFISGGAGAGQTTKLTAITNSSGVYTCTVQDALRGISSTKGSTVNFEHWNDLTTVSYTSENNKFGMVEIPLKEVKSKFVDVKVIMEGNEVEIEELQIIQSPAKLSA